MSYRAFFILGVKYADENACVNSSERSETKSWRMPCRAERTVRSVRHVLLHTFRPRRGNDARERGMSWIC